MRHLKSAGSASSPTATRSPCSAALVEERRADRVPDLLLLLQHPPVITLGVKGDGGRSNIVAEPTGSRSSASRFQKPGAAAT